MNPTNGPTAAGPNSWLIDELFGQYQDDPRSVPEEWRGLFDSGAGSTSLRRPPWRPPRRWRHRRR